MKARVSLVVAVAVLAVLAGGCEDKSAPSSRTSTSHATGPSKPTGTLEPQHILGYELPTDVAALEADLGLPDSIERPAADDPSPWGQWLEWGRPDGSTFRALADDYSSTSTDKKAGVRYIELRAAPEPQDGFETYTPTIQGFVLNESDIYTIFDALPGNRPSTVHDRGELDAFDIYRDTILYEKDGLYTYYFFDGAGFLVGVGQATVNMDGAD